MFALRCHMDTLGGKGLIVMSHLEKVDRRDHQYASIYFRPLKKVNVY